MQKNAIFGIIDAKNALIIQLMDIQQITSFLTLADELHFWRASFKLNITQSALSRQIQSLENELSLSLFNRSKRKVELTAAGKFLYQQWEPLMQQLTYSTRYAQKIHRGEYGSLTINHPGSISHNLLPDLLARISKLYPDVKVELVQLKYTQEEEFLKAFKIDIAYSRYEHKSDFIESKLVWKENFGFAVPINHPIQSEEDLTSDILKQQRFVLPTLQHGYIFPETIFSIFNHYQINPVISYESDFGSTVLSLVAKGLGIAILPFSFAQQAPPNIRFIKIPFEIPLYLYWRKNEDNPLITNILKLT
ncbi:LysR family transcriptional regulator [Xanthocytophaga flava]|uniref:LysR family transcriptional regulator n=1 Tax=Xanthocytophaga flava TaxID=3048013 RepID=UPI0028D57C33|nr:LysR family transcriptional regulator [Xanthocytophaga flavus]MDJ1466747.1 LysR family transcriptional regulator [Xanthocytophaga flavus]